MCNKVAVVTGANKGIGLAITKGLCRRFTGVVYLTSRDVSKGKAAVIELNELGLYPEYHQLDVTDWNSVIVFRKHIEQKYGRIDILINNAGVTSNVLGTNYEDCKKTIDTNYIGLINVQELLFPLLKENARVLNISSSCGHLSNLRNKFWIKRLSANNLHRNDVDDFVNWFLTSVKNGTFKSSWLANGGTVAAYRVSKIAVSALTILQQKDLISKNISVNSVHPGFVSTDLTKGFGSLTPDQSAKTPLYLVLDAPASIKGAYIWHDGRELDWFDYNADYYFRMLSVPREAGKKGLRYLLSVLKNPIVIIMIFVMIIYYYYV